MEARLLGIQIIDFTPPGEAPIKGTKLFMAYPENGVSGEVAEKKFFPDGFGLPSLKPGDLLNLDCTIKGKVVGVKVIPETGPTSPPASK